MLARRVLVLALLAPAACSIPGRDNRLDPTNVPEARVEIYENATGGVPIVQASYTESIFFAAGKSEPSSHDLRVSWRVELTNPETGAVESYGVAGGNELPIGTRQTVRLNNVIPFERMKEGVLGIVVIGRVRDPETGGVAEGSRFFQVVNSAPVIVAQTYLEVTPGGRWWVANGGALQTVLDVTVTDPDPGDSPVTVEWEQISGRPVVAGPAPQQDDLLVSAPLWEQTVVFRATARDTAQFETTTEITLAVQDVVWLADETGFISRVQEPPIAVLTTNAGWTIGAATSATGGTIVWTAEDDGNTWRVVRRAPEIGAALESSFDTGISNAEPLVGAAFTNNDGIAWAGFGDTVLAFDDSLGTAAAPVRSDSGFTLFALDDGLTAPHSLAPVLASADGDAWGLFDEGTPAVRRLSALTGPSGTALTIADAVAIEPAAGGGAWVLVSRPADPAFEPEVVHLDASGAETHRLALPYPATARARTFSARAPLQPAAESVRFAIAGGAGQSAFLALVDARDAITDLPSNGVDGDPVLRVAFRLQESPVSDVALDPQDGGAWSVVPATGVVRKHDFLGNVVRLTGALGLSGSVPPTIKSDVRTGTAWVADQGAKLTGVPGTPLVPYPASNVLSLPDSLDLDPAGNRLAASSLGDGSVVVLGAGVMRNQFFLPDLGGVTGPVGATFDLENRCLWFASETRLRRHVCEDRLTLPNVAHAPLQTIRGLDYASWYDPGAGVDPGLCVAGTGTDGTLRMIRLDVDGAPVWVSPALGGVDMLGVAASPLRGDCWFLTDTQVGFADAQTGALSRIAPGTDIGLSLTVGPDGSAFYIDPDDDEVVRVTDALTIDPSFLAFQSTDTFRFARTVSVDPVRGVIWVTVGPKNGVESAAALLQFAPDGERIGLVPAVDPRFLSVNR